MNNKKLKLWLYIGLHFLKKENKKNKNSNIFLTLYLGITFGLMVLIVVIGVMNGFQEIHITRRIEIGSYHFTISKKDFKTFNLPESLELKNKLYTNYKEIQAIVPFSDKECILRLNNNLFNIEQIIKVRAIDFDEVNKDTNFLKYFKLEYNSLKLNPVEDSIIMGKEILANTLNIKNQKIFITPDIRLSSFKNIGIPFNIYDTFYSGSYFYDKNWAFIPLKSLKKLTGKIEIDKIGIKLKNRANQRIFLENIKKFLGNDFILQTAEEANYGYFFALRVEKTMIIVLFLLIFLMVAVNIFGVQKLTILEKKEDICILKAIGASTYDIEIIFLIESIILGFLGTLSGVIIGIFIAYNISNIFLITERIINSILIYISYSVEYMLPGFYFIPVKLYNDEIYYQSLSTVKLYYHEMLFISLAIICMLILAAYLPARKTSSYKPIELIKK